MKLEDYNYELPEDKIAKYPPKVRGNSRLLVLNSATGEVSDRKYGDFVDFLEKGDVLILNDTKVIKARLHGETTSGKAVELVLLESHGDDTDRDTHSSLYRGKLKAGDELIIAGYKITVKEILGEGIARLNCEIAFAELLEKVGEVPIPPYLKRASEEIDQQRYQTVFAQEPGSVAAPTASLNFTAEVEQRLRAKGVSIRYLTLHVGLGTFLPIRVEDLEQHKMHSEYYDIPAETIQVINTARGNGSKVMAIGTTVTRALEHAAENIISQGKTGEFSGIRAEADIFIYPGYEFKLVSQLLTNFHAPKTTVLMLAAAIAGWENLENAYKHALNHDYRFLSYGDSMLIL